MRPRIIQNKKRNRHRDFWYSGDIAHIGNYYLIATGEIRVNFNDPLWSDTEDSWYLDGDAVIEAERRGYTDADMDNWTFDNNNWFEVVYGEENGNVIDSTFGDIADTYETGMEMLKMYYRERMYGDDSYGVVTEGGTKTRIMTDTDADKFIKKLFSGKSG